MGQMMKAAGIAGAVAVAIGVAFMLVAYVKDGRLPDPLPQQFLMPPPQR